MHVSSVRAMALGLGCVLLLFAGTLGRAGDISYVYDAIGRLQAVIDPATNTAIYQYDAVGNLTGITRQTSATLAILSVTPTAGPVGTVVTIVGTGFSATPSSNLVKFNGTTATVTAADTMTLTTSVPSGATTGTITVTVGANTETSTTVYTVTVGQAPTISGFTPTAGPSGTAVTVTGTNYQTVLGDNRVSIGNTYGTVTSATSTSLTVTVPVGAQSGRIGVTTVGGSALSAQEFFLTPPGVSAGDVGYNGRIVAGGASVTATIPANKVGLVVFDGVGGQRLGLGMTGVTIAQSAVSIVRPDGGTLVASVNISTAGGSIDTPPLPMTGTYTILIDPTATYAGNMALTLSAEMTGTITIAGAAVPISITRVGQNARYSFAGTSGQTISMGMTASSIPNGNVTIYKPDGSVLAGQTALSNGAVDSQILPTTGTYAILVDPSQHYTGNVTLTLYGTPDVTGTLTIDGPPVTTTLTVPGQRARYTFVGSAGQLVSLGASSVTTTTSTVSILKPDGTQLASTSIGTSGGSVDPPALPSSGSYTVVVDPSQAYTGAMTLTLSTSVNGTILLDGAPVTFTTSRPGQNGVYTFSGTAGQIVSVGITGVTTPSATISALKPDGTVLSSTSVTTAGGSLYPPVLPTTGTYSIKVDPGAANTGSVILKLNSMTTAPITIDGGSVGLTTTAPGQTKGVTFTGASGQLLSVGFTGVSIPSSFISLLKPDGTALTNTSTSTAGSSWDFPALPVAGNYTIKVDPQAVSTGLMTVTLSSELTGTLSLNAAATAVSLSRPGQNARYSFSGTAGQQVTVRITGNTFGTVYVYLYNQSGGYLTGVGNSGAAFNLSSVTLSVTGTYSVTVNPYGLTAGTLNLQVTSP